jgi:hypothetical protein
MTKLELQEFIEPRLLAVCRLQAEIINELHPKVFGFPSIDAKVTELQRMFEDANLDEPLRKIQREVALGVAMHIFGNVDHNGDEPYFIELAEEWVKDNE